MVLRENGEYESDDEVIEEPAEYLVDKLGLKKTNHPRPYGLKWLNDESELKIFE